MTFWDVFLSVCVFLYLGFIAAPTFQYRSNRRQLVARRMDVRADDQVLDLFIEARPEGFANGLAAWAGFDVWTRLLGAGRTLTLSQAALTDRKVRPIPLETINEVYARRSRPGWELTAIGIPESARRRLAVENGQRVWLCFG